MIKEYTQTTYETCLAVSLLQAVGKINKKLELDCIIHSLKFSKDDFVVGHIDFIQNNFSVKITRLVDNKLFYNYLKDIKATDLIETKIVKIDLELIDNLLKNNKPILYLDSYCLFKITHSPHFVTVIDKIGNSYKIFDPWDGKFKEISSKIVLEGIESLRNHLKFCPQILLIADKKKSD